MPMAHRAPSRKPYQLLLPETLVALERSFRRFKYRIWRRRFWILLDCLPIVASVSKQCL